MRIKKRSSSLRGEVKIQILPILMVLAIFGLVLARQAWEKFSFVKGFTLDPAEVESTASSALPDKKVNFSLQLTPDGARRLADWAASHPGGEVPIVFSGTYLGTIKLEPGMDTHTLHMVADPDAALATRYKLGK